MPEVPFIQVMALAGLLAILAVVLAMPVGMARGARAGRLVLRGSLIGVLVVFAACLVWGASSGDLARFNAAMGIGDWLQMGAFFLIIYGTGYRFVSSYLTDKAKESPDA